MPKRHPFLSKFSPPVPFLGNSTLETFFIICIYLQIKPWELMEKALSAKWDKVVQRELKRKRP